MMQKQPEIGEFYTRKNGKVYEIRESHDICTGCSFKGNPKKCDKILCTHEVSIIYVRRKDLEG